MNWPDCETPSWKASGCADSARCARPDRVGCRRQRRQVKAATVGHRQRLAVVPADVLGLCRRRRCVAGMGRGADLAADLAQMVVHRDGIGDRHDDRGRFALARADRTKHIGRDGSRRSSAAAGRPPGWTTPGSGCSSADPRLVLQPSLHSRSACLRRRTRWNCKPRVAETPPAPSRWPGDGAAAAPTSSTASDAAGDRCSTSLLHIKLLLQDALRFYRETPPPHPAWSAPATMPFNVPPLPHPQAAAGPDAGRSAVPRSLLPHNGYATHRPRFGSARKAAPLPAGPIPSERRLAMHQNPLTAPPPSCRGEPPQRAAPVRCESKTYGPQPYDVHSSIHSTRSGTSREARITRPWPCGPRATRRKNPSPSP